MISLHPNSDPLKWDLPVHFIDEEMDLERLNALPKVIQLMRMDRVLTVLLDLKVHALNNCTTKSHFLMLILETF